MCKPRDCGSRCDITHMAPPGPAPQFPPLPSTTACSHLRGLPPSLPHFHPPCPSSVLPAPPAACFSPVKSALSHLLKTRPQPSSGNAGSSSRSEGDGHPRNGVFLGIRDVRCRPLPGLGSGRPARQVWEYKRVNVCKGVCASSPSPIKLCSQHGSGSLVAVSASPPPDGASSTMPTLPGRARPNCASPQREAP